MVKNCKSNFVSRLSVLGQAPMIPDTKSLFICPSQSENISAENQDWQEQAEISNFPDILPNFCQGPWGMKAIHNDRGC